MPEQPPTPNTGKAEPGLSAWWLVPLIGFLIGSYGLLWWLA